ncbi:MAG: hypothetical protein H6923_04025 [Alphaproteobacteria bacterium]|nr:hypothetical protein [Alphaproteobacteria bacterium]
MAPIMATRRDVALGAAALALAGGARAAAGEAGALVHAIPAASARSLSLTCSFAEPVSAARLDVAGTPARARRMDSAGRYWRFEADGLAPGTAHELRLASDTRQLAEPWTLKTLPDPAAGETRLRILSFTCAGGWEGARRASGEASFRPLALRRRLLDRALAFAPDVVIANGDHVYWDLTVWQDYQPPEDQALTSKGFDAFGRFDRDKALIGTENEEVLTRIGEAQIASLYGTRLKGVPCFFIGDDHDYYEGDVANSKRITFPPEDFNVRAQAATAALFYPDFLPDGTRPAGLSGASEGRPGANQCFGTLRWGRLFEAALFDCARYMSLSGPFAGLVPPDAERWLLSRAAESDAANFLYVPSHPVGWSAGKWREWYPDVLDREAAARGEPRLTTQAEKYFWQEGWRSQHQRLLAALGARRSPRAIISGDLHAVGWGRIARSYDLDFATDPIMSVLTGPVSTHGRGWPSAARGVPPQIPLGLEIAQTSPPIEKNGFTILDVTPEAMTFRLFAWREPDPVEAIDTLEPFDVVEVRRA